MGHRALLAYRRGDDHDRSTDETATYDLHRSHWGGVEFALLDHLSADAPYAADTPFAVDPEPVATDLTLSAIAANHLNFLHHEAFYRVGPAYRPTAFHPVWFGLEVDSESVERSETVGHGALVEAVPADANYFRGWVRGTKAIVGEMVDRDAFGREAATEYLAERIRSWADGREVIRPE